MAIKVPEKNKIPYKLGYASEIVYRRCLLIGASGVGKTTLLGSAHRDSRCTPTVVLDIDKSASSLIGLKNDGGIEIAVMGIDRFEDFDDIYDYLESGESPFKSIIIDSITEVHIQSILTVIDERIAKDGGKGDPYETWQSDYGHSQNHLRRMIRLFKKLPMHLFMSSLVSTSSLPGEGIVRVPALAGQMSEEVVQNVDCCWSYIRKETKNIRTKTIESSRQLILQNTPGIRAKTRAPYGITIPNEINVPENPTDPTITRLFDLLGVK